MQERGPGRCGSGDRRSDGRGSRRRGRRGRRALAALFALATLSALAGVASAHGTAVETPPVPVPALVAGAALAVGGTAVGLAVGPDPPTGRVRLGSLDADVVRAFAVAVRALAVVALAAAVVSGLTSRAAVTFAEILVWPVLFKGSLVVAAAVGSPWRLLSPWHVAYDALAALEGGELGAREYPDRLGSWPAVLGLVAVVGVAENLTVVPDDGRLTVVVLAAYAFAMLALALAFGRDALDRADAFAVLYRLAGRVAPVAFEREPGPDGERVVAVLRPPWVGSARPLPDVATAAFVVVAAATVTFDGAVETTVAARALAALGSLVGAYAGLAIYVGFLAAFLAGAVLVRRAVSVAAGTPASPDGGTTTAPGGADEVVDAEGVLRYLAATLLPIAVAYDVAHNYPYVLVNATRLVERAFGAAGVPLAVDASSALAPVAVWATQVALVVGGHLVAVVAAHLATERAFPDARRARRGHAPLAALMVAYTVASLYVLAAP
ncbi:hypothetical protein [Halorubellus sp. PRR65]|uniref:hypothetical protein n=1 Tax=Halorubellus sp. PRR65 TaxID=3098148 RepID=UPI002B25AFFC|nr:hypothetical protein [Halorubellus sp. PRR65]